MKSTLSRYGSRALSPWNRFPLGLFRDEMEDLWSRFLPAEGGGELVRYLPRIDVSESDKMIEVKADVPGFKPEDIDVQLHDDLLTITGTMHEEKTKEDEGRTYHVVERRSGSFSRSITLPTEVDDTHVEAKFEGGVLTIVLPKTEAAKSHKIEIKS
jgi:HSP20 family protein